MSVSIAPSASTKAPDRTAAFEALPAVAVTSPPGESVAESVSEETGRRTVVIKGRGAERNLPWESGIAPRRSSRLPHHRTTFKPDRVAMWAVFLGLLLVLVAAMSAH